MRITILIALPSGLGLSVLARPIMKFIYDRSTAMIAEAALEVLGFVVVFICLVAPINAMLQVLGFALIFRKNRACWRWYQTAFEHTADT